MKEALKKNKIGSLIGVEGGQSIQSSLGTLRMFYEMGVRYLTLTHNCITPFFKEWCPAPSLEGNTPYGSVAHGVPQVNPEDDGPL